MYLKLSSFITIVMLLGLLTSNSSLQAGSDQGSAPPKDLVAISVQFSYGQPSGYYYYSYPDSYYDGDYYYSGQNYYPYYYGGYYNYPTYYYYPNRYYNRDGYGWGNRGWDKGNHGWHGGGKYHKH